MSQHFPTRIGLYLPERLIGRGAMAAVYLCRAPDGSAVAVKWMDQPHPALLRRFEREIAALGKVDHPGVVSVLDHGEEDGRPFLVMTYEEGVDLRVYAPKLHQRAPAERYARVRAIGAALAQVLDHLHQHQLVHRDVKPSNVLLTEDGRVVLTDFGVVKDLGDPERTAAGTVVGTIAFAAPEQVEGEAVEPRTDLFGLGATLYYLLTQRRPFEGLSRSTLPPPSRFDPGIPPDLEAVVLRLMAPHPHHRYPDARTAGAALAAGRPEGVTIAGRQAALDAVAHALSRAREGVPVVVRPRGPLGAGKGWLSDMVRQNARRSGIPVYVLRDGEPPDEALDELRSGRGSVVVSPIDLELPEGVEQVDIPLQSLGLADVRRTVVGAAPRTREPARVAELLHRLTGGIPGLLVPLIGRYTVDEALDLPDPVEAPSVLDDYTGGLDLDDTEVLGVLSLTDEPASAALIERVTMAPAEASLTTLEARGIARQIDGRWCITAELFRAAGRGGTVDPIGMAERIERARAELGESSSLERLRAELAGIDTLTREDELQLALSGARAAVQSSAALGLAASQCAALNALGLVLLEADRPTEATAVLADATALARAADRTDEHRLSHVLRAAATLDERPRDRAAAAAAIDRLLPLLGGAASRPSNATDARLFATWARAAAILGDRGGWMKGEQEAATRLPGLSDQERPPVLFELGRAAFLRGDRAAAERWLQEIDAGASPLHARKAQALLGHP
jgi:hypothetical protein